MLNIASDDQSNAIDWLPSFFFFHLSSFFRSLDIHSDKSNRKISDCSNRCPYERLVHYLCLRVASCAATNEIIDCVFVDAASEIIVSCCRAGYGMGTIMEKYAWDVQMPTEHDDDIQVERLEVCVWREREKKTIDSSSDGKWSSISTLIKTEEWDSILTVNAFNQCI